MMAQQEAAQFSKEDKRAVREPLTHYAWLSLLRAYGVVLVLAYHFFPWLMPGGFIGVDVFFVFSGYLITSLLIKEVKKRGKVDVIAFYKRRFRRLFPALLAMLLVVLALALTIPEDFRADIVRQTAAALSWTTNYYEIATGQSYANALVPHLFVHTWTLSIEMQYYLLWGLLLSVLLPLFINTTAGGRKSIAASRKVVAVLAVILAVASYGVMQIMLIGAEDPSAAYYSTLSHAYPILIGSALGALAGFGHTRWVVFFERLSPQWAIALVVLSLAAILAMAIFLPFENRFVYHGGLLLTSLLVGLVILVGRGSQHALQQLPEPKLLKYLADRSFSIYLFHWPLLIIVLAWARALFGRVQIGVDAVYIIASLFALALTFVISHLCYRYVERPFASKYGSAARHLAAHAPASTTMPPPASAATHAAHASDTADPPESSTSTPLSTPTSAAAPASTPTPATARSHDASSQTQTRHAPQKSHSKFTTSKLALIPLALLLALASVFTLASAPLKTSIEADYQVGLMEIDARQMEYSHRALLHTGEGGSMNGAPGLSVKPDTVTVIGDSVAILPADDITRITDAAVDAEVSRAMVNGIRIVQEMQENNSLGAYVVIALATNAQPNSFESATVLCEELAPGHRLIFVTAYGNESMDELSAQLRTLPSTYSFVTIADWHTAIKAHNDLLAADGYHLNDQAAIDIYVNVIVTALEEAKNTPTS